MNTVYNNFHAFLNAKWRGNVHLYLFSCPLSSDLIFRIGSLKKKKKKKKTPEDINLQSLLHEKHRIEA
jgi:hypothetical protein